MKNLSLYLLLLAGLSNGISNAQGLAQFTLAQTHNTVYNPAYYLSSKSGFIETAYRQQWIGVDGAPETSLINAAVRLFKYQPKKQAAIGINASIDKIGFYRSQNLRMAYVHGINIKKLKLQVALQPGISYLNTDYSRLHAFHSQDPLNQTDVQVVRYNTTLAFNLQYSMFYLGMASYIPIHRKFSDLVEKELAHQFVDFGLRLNGPFSTLIHPAVQLKNYGDLQGFENLSAEMQLMVAFRQKFNVGLAYRHKESISPLINLQINRRLSFSYAYDIGTNELSRASSGSHEFWLRFNFLNFGLQGVNNPRHPKR